MILRTVTLQSQLGTVVLGEPSYATGDAVGYTLDEVSMNAGGRRLQREGYPLAPGATVAQSPIDAREVALTGTLWAGSAAAANALRSQLVAATTGDVAIRYTPQETTVELSGVLDATVEFQPLGGYAMRWRLRLVCADPIAYATTTTTAPVGGTSAALVNSGDGEVYPDLVATVVSGTLTGLSITNSRSYRSVSLSGLSATAGTTITIVQRPGYEEVLVGSTAAMHRLTSTSRFWSLLPGSNATAVVATGGSVEVSAIYRSGWVS